MVQPHAWVVIFLQAAEAVAVTSHNMALLEVLEAQVAVAVDITAV
jgi:hypothetical protein